MNPRPFLLLTLAAAMALAGCSSQQRAAPVNPDGARNALRTALDAWKSGSKPDQLQSASPPMTVQDFDWMAGFQLVDYQVEGSGTDDDANLRIPVQLTLRDPDGREVKKRVSYVVGTSPSVTVFREML